MYKERSRRLRNSFFYADGEIFAYSDEEEVDEGAMLN